MGACFSERLCLAISVFFIFACFGAAKADTLHESIIRGYHKECMRVNAQKGMDVESTTRLCDCEVRVLDQHFNTMSTMMLQAHAVSGAKPSDDELNEIRRKINACKQ